MAKTDTTPATPVEGEQTEAQKKAAARNRAQNALNAKYRDELQTLTKAEFEAAGLTYNPKKTDEEKAAEKLAAILSDFPHLAEQVASKEDQPTQG